MARNKAPRPLLTEGAIYSEPELAELLHVGVTALRGLRQSGQLRYLAVGRRIVYPSKFIQEYMDRAGTLQGEQNGPLGLVVGRLLRGDSQAR